MKVRSLSPNRYLRELKLMNETLFMLQKKNKKNLASKKKFSTDMLQNNYDVT